MAMPTLRLLCYVSLGGERFRDSVEETSFQVSLQVTKHNEQVTRTLGTKRIGMTGENR